MSSKTELNKELGASECARTMLRAEVIDLIAKLDQARRWESAYILGLQARLDAAHKRLAAKRWPWYRRLALALRHPFRRTP